MKFLARQPNRQHLRMCRGIVRRSDLVRALGDDVAIFCDNTTERAATPRTDIRNRKLNGAGHESVVHWAWFRHRVIVKGVKISAARESTGKGSARK